MAVASGLVTQLVTGRFKATAAQACDGAAEAVWLRTLLESVSRNTAIFYRRHVQGLSVVRAAAHKMFGSWTGHKICLRICSSAPQNVRSEKTARTGRSSRVLLTTRKPSYCSVRLRRLWEERERGRETGTGQGGRSVLPCSSEGKRFSRHFRHRSSPERPQIFGCLI